MTAELTLREKVLGVLNELFEDETVQPWSTNHALFRIADLLSATGAPAYIRVADDLRGVVREEETVTKLYGTYVPPTREGGMGGWIYSNGPTIIEDDDK